MGVNEWKSEFKNDIGYLIREYFEHCFLCLWAQSSASRLAFRLNTFMVTYDLESFPEEQEGISSIRYKSYHFFLFVKIILSVWLLLISSLVLDTMLDTLSML